MATRRGGDTTGTLPRFRVLQELAQWRVPPVTAAVLAIGAAVILGAMAFTYHARPTVDAAAADPRAPASTAAQPATDAAPDPFEFTASGVFARVPAAGSLAVMPVLGITRAQLANTFGEPRADDRRHIGIDIAAPQGTPVVAALDGWIVALPFGGAGGRGLHLLDRTGSYVLYYAHLDGYAEGVWPGMAVRQREVIGYVGTTGNAATPHLHFEVGRVRRPGSLQVDPINPFEFLTR